MVTLLKGIFYRLFSVHGIANFSNNFPSFYLVSNAHANVHCCPIKLSQRNHPFSKQKLCVAANWPNRCTRSILGFKFWVKICLIVLLYKDSLVHSAYLTSYLVTCLIELLHLCNSGWKIMHIMQTLIYVHKLFMPMKIIITCIRG